MTYTESARAQLDALQVKDHVRILALETSCDETAAAIIGWAHHRLQHRFQPD